MTGTNHQKQQNPMTKKQLLTIAIFILSVIFYGCLDASESDYERQVREADEFLDEYLSSNSIETEKQSSGVHLEVINENEDGKEIVEDHVVGILYEMRHLEGEYLVESYSDTSNPVWFSNSYNATYPSIYPAGLNLEIGKMREGEKYRFYIPSYQAFGDYHHDELFDIYSHFMMEVDVVEVKTEEEMYELELEKIQNYITANEPDAESYPNGLYYVVREEGDSDKPSSGGQVEIHFTRKYLDGTIIESTEDDDPITLNLNNNQLVSGLENGIPLMQEGEKAVFIMPSKLAFGKSVQLIPQDQELREDLAENGIVPQVKPYSPLIYEIELISAN